MATRTHRRRGHVEERPNGSFRAVVYAGIDPLTHKPRYLKETAPTWGDAEEALTRLLRQVDEKRTLGRRSPSAKSSRSGSRLPAMRIAPGSGTRSLSGSTSGRHFTTYRRPKSMPSCWRASTHGSLPVVKCAAERDGPTTNVPR